MFNAEMMRSQCSILNFDRLSMSSIDLLSDIGLEIAENKSDYDLSDRFEMIEWPKVKIDSFEMMMNKGVKIDEESKESQEEIVLLFSI